MKEVVYIMDLSKIPKEAAFLIIKELFSQMCSSRRRLKPILNEIIRAIDNHVFIDADTEEVKNLLEEILMMQDQLSKTEDLKSAAATKKLAVIDEAIREIDQNYIITELKTVLARFKNLVCDSEDENEIDSAKKLKRQAHKLSIKAEKINAEMFAKEGNKFIDIAEKIDDPSTLTSTSFLEIQNNFPENKILPYAIMKRSLHFENEDKTEIENVDKEPENIPEHIPEDLPEITKDKNSLNNVEQDFLKKRLESLQMVIKEYKVPVEEALINEDEITIEKKNLKKKLSVKSLNNKLHEFVDGSESISFPILRTFCKSRIFSADPAFENSHDEKARLLIPVMVDKLFNWGIADKVYWGDLKFYYLNDQGREMLSRVLSIKESKNTVKTSNESVKKRISAYLRRFVLFSTIWALKIKKNNNKIDGDANRFWIRSLVRVPNGSIQVFFSFSLMFFDDNWIKNLDNFINAFKEEMKSSREVKGVFLISNITQEQMKPWVKFFNALGVGNIYMFLIDTDGCKIIDETGNEIIPSEWTELVSFGKINKADILDDKGIDEDIDNDIKDEDISGFHQNAGEDEIYTNIADIDNEYVETKEEKTEYLIELLNQGKLNGGILTCDELVNVIRKYDLSFNDIGALYEKLSQNGIEVIDDEDDDDDEEEENIDESIEDKDKDNDNDTVTVEDTKKSAADKYIDKPLKEKIKDNFGISETKEEVNKPFTSVKDTIKIPREAANKSFSTNYAAMAGKILENLPEEDRMVQSLLFTAAKFFVEGSACRGMLFLHLLAARQLSKDEDWALNLGIEAGYILDDPMSGQQQRSMDPFDFWDSYFSIPNVEADELCDYLNLAAIIKAFFAPPEPMSFQLKSRWNQLNDDKSNRALKACPSVKKLINLFKTFAEQTHASFASCVNIDNSTIEIELKNAMESIKAVRERTDAVAHMQISHPRSKGLVKILYEPDGQVRRLLNIENGDVSVESIIDFCSDFTDDDIKRLENQGVKVTEEIFSEVKIGDYLDDIWKSIKVDSKKNEKFTSVERPRQVNVLKQALVALLSYAFAKKHMESIKNSGKLKAPVLKALEILSDIVDEFNEIEQNVSINFIGPAVFIIFIERLAIQVNGMDFLPFYRECLLGPKYLELNNDGLPSAKSYGVAAFSFASRVFEFEEAVKNLTIKEAVNAAYETAVRSCDLGILKLLEANFREALDRSDEELKRRQDNVSKQVDRQIERIYHEFLDNLELDKNYDRITNQEEIDHFINAATEAKEHFSLTKNAGLYQRFINACRADIAKTALPHKNAMLQRLNTLKEKLYNDLASGEKLEEKYPIIVEIQRQLDIGNLTVAEDYLNRWDDNNGQFNDLNVVENQNDAFESFLKEYEYIFNSCLKNKSESLEKIHTKMRGGVPKNRSERDAVNFVSAWQGLNTDLKSRAETSIIELLKHLSFSNPVIDTADKIPPNQWNFHANFPDYRRSKAAYPHPFAVYGTDIANKGLAIIYLASNRTADNIIETLANYGLKQDCGIICLVDFALSLAERRKLAQAFKLRPDLKDIIVIDRVMAIYLTRFEDNVRGVKMLKTALPFARIQPYTTGGVVAPEMFIGRSKELAKIRDMSGPVFVYGGRQLGKSALLRQVRNIENDPDAANFAFFIELKGLDADKSLEKIVRELKEAGLINENEPINNWDDFSFVIKDLMSGKSEKFNVIPEGKTPKKLILLLDESDEFLVSVENTENRAIDVLRELRETFNGSFKFVLAGLHKVIRFEKNSSFGNLDHISVLPFTPTDALELLLKPMSYLGFVIEDESLMSAIFSRANYYPGLIQYYCKMIVDAAGDNYSQRNFEVTKNPPYKLDDEYLKNMLGKRDFQEEINKKFQITLKLDDDNYYEVIALVIAEAYYENNRPVHVSLDKIKETCYLYDIDKISDMSDAELENLLGEMVELNLLRKVDGNYEFNRYAFWHMMGTENEVNTRLTTYGN